jgi:hypothetical protein
VFGDAVGVEGAFGVDVAGAVLFPGSATGGHHQAAIAGRESIYLWGSGYFAGGQAQCRKQQPTARTPHILMPRRRGPDDCAIRPLLVEPARPEGFQKVVSPVTQSTLLNSQVS